MNSFMETQCKNMISSLKLFSDGIDIAAIKDDGKVSPEEAKQLKRLHKAAEKFEAEIRKAMKD